MMNRIPKKIFLLLLSGWFTGMALAQPDPEANLKAAFIYNFTRYIEWDSAANAGKDFVIGVMGPSPVADALSLISANNKVNNKRIVVQQYAKPEDIGSCQVLFIPKKIPYSLPSILERVNKGVLTISEEPGFARLGTALNFVLIKQKLKFEASLKAFVISGLRASSQLLKLAIIVD